MVSLKNRLLSVIPVILAFTASAALGDTFLEGALRGQLTRDGNPHIVMGDSVYIQSGDTLAIYPGVEVMFFENHGLWIEGTLLVYGQPGDTVLFTSSGSLQPGSWQGITFFGRGASGSRINRLRVEYGYHNIFTVNCSPYFYGVVSYAALGNCARSQDADPVWRHFRFRQKQNTNSQPAVTVSGGEPEFGPGRIRGSNTGEDGMKFLNLAEPWVHDVDIDTVQDNGIDGENIRYALFERVTIRDAGLRGIYLSNCDNVTIKRCLIYNSRGPGIFVSGGDDNLVTNTSIFSAGHYGLISDGIFLAGQGVGIVIKNNIIGYCTGYGLNSPHTRLSSAYCCYYENTQGSYGGLANQGGAGFGEIFDDPLVDNITFELDPESPCIDAGNPEEYDPDCSRTDMGAKYYKQNDDPVIDDWSPVELELGGYSWGDPVEFSVSATDTLHDELEYAWFYQGMMVGTGNTATINMFNNSFPDSVWVIVGDECDGRDTLTWQVDVVGVEEKDDITAAPHRFEIAAAYPNPFNAVLQIEMNLPAAGKLELQVFDILGREVYYSEALHSPGVVPLEVDAAEWSSGLYFVRAHFAGEEAVRRVVLLK